MNNSLKKAFNLAKKTGDRVIVIDNDPEADALVVMNIDEYEKILSYKETYLRSIKGLTEDQLIDKINCDIALWKSEQEENDNKEPDIPLDISEEDLEEDMYYYSEPEWQFDFWDRYPLEGENDELEEPNEEDKDEDNDDDEDNNKDREREEESKEYRSDGKNKESIFEKFNREQKEYSRQEESTDWTGKNDWKIPFDVKAGADEVNE
jgi:hypothetical protein